MDPKSNSDGSSAIADDKNKPKNTFESEQHALAEIPLEELPKSWWDRSWPVIACGAGLFSDGYLNAVRTDALLPQCDKILAFFFLFFSRCLISMRNRP